MISRFELHTLCRTPNQPLSVFGSHVTASLNVIMSQITSVNDVVLDLTRFHLLRLYLIKTTRGRSHALGKPSRGQRTWSNAWTAYNHNRVTRAFVNAYQKKLNENMKEEKINYKVLKKKSFQKKKKDTVTKVIIRVGNWF